MNFRNFLKAIKRALGSRHLHYWEVNFIGQIKRSVRQSVCSACPCRLCKVYLQSVRYL